MLGTFSVKMRQPCEMLASSLLGLCYFSIFGSSWPHLGAILAQFGKVWARFLRRVWGSIFKVFQEGLGSILKVFQEGLVHNVNSMFKHFGHGNAWAGGVTRSVKN